MIVVHRNTIQEDTMRNVYVAQDVSAVQTSVARPEMFVVGLITATDTARIAQLMLDAYRGTVDDAGETLAEALHEVHGFWAGTAGVTPWAEMCMGVRVGDEVVAACLVGEWQSRQVPLIAYVLTHPAWQRRGLASALVGRALRHLWQHQRWPVYAVITAGNLPSERMMMRAGFERFAQTLV
jgi:GNAT superfamily N-acetyltransferase